MPSKKSFVDEYDITNFVRIKVCQWGDFKLGQADLYKWRFLVRIVQFNKSRYFECWLQRSARSSEDNARQSPYHSWELQRCHDFTIDLCLQGMLSIRLCKLFCNVCFLVQVFDLIMDRNQSLLPAYLVLDEIVKKSNPNYRWPHWVSLT